MTTFRPDGLVEEVVVALDDGGDVLLLHRTGSDAWAGLWWLPGGGVESGETPEAAARREVEEETGWVLTEVRHLWEVTEPVTGFRVHLYDAPVERDTPRLNAEHDDWRWDRPRTFLDQDIHDRGVRDAVFAAWVDVVAKPLIAVLEER